MRRVCRAFGLLTEATVDAYVLFVCALGWLALLILAIARNRPSLAGCALAAGFITTVVAKAFWDRARRAKPDDHTRANRN